MAKPKSSAPQASPAAPPPAGALSISGSGKVVGVGSISGSGHAAPGNPGPQAAPAPAAVPAAAAVPTRSSLRALLREVLRLDAELDAFCLDFFPAT